MMGLFTTNINLWRLDCSRLYLRAYLSRLGVSFLSSPLPRNPVTWEAGPQLHGLKKDLLVSEHLCGLDLGHPVDAGVNGSMRL